MNLIGKLFKTQYKTNTKRLRKYLTTTSTMANSRFDYVKSFESDDRILPNCWIIVRIDGKAFHKFTKAHNFEKPNDDNGLNLMNYAAVAVMEEYRDIIMAYGQSDEYSFVFHKAATIYNRRSAKIMSNVNSLFTSSYVYNWSTWFPNTPLLCPPSFDARVILYPSDQNLKDYLSWRQADVHINNLYNTAFWNLVKSGCTNAEAETELRGTFSADKNELLFTRFNINYNNLPAVYRKGTILLRKSIRLPKPNSHRQRQLIIPFSVDMIREKFWREHPELLENKKPSFYEFQRNGMEDDVELPDIVLKQIEMLTLDR